MYRYTRFAVLFALAASCIVSSSALAEPMTPIVADWAVANAGEINERMRKRIKEYVTDGGELSRLADLDASDVRLYHRDNQLLMAISVNFLSHSPSSSNVVCKSSAVSSSPRIVANVRAVP